MHAGKIIAPCERYPQGSRLWQIFKVLWRNSAYGHKGLTGFELNQELHARGWETCLSPSTWLAALRQELGKEPDWKYTLPDAERVTENGKVVYIFRLMRRGQLALL